MLKSKCHCHSVVVISADFYVTINFRSRDKGRAMISNRYIGSNFVNSIRSASSLSVSLIFKVWSPVKWQPIPKPRHVTTIVCAISGIV
jgi:hypothetical protein